MEEKNELRELRAEIDSVDEDVLNSLAKRTALVKKIGRYKATHNIEAVDEGRRDALLRTWVERGEALGLSKEFVTAINKLVHDYSVTVEKNL